MAEEGGGLLLTLLTLPILGAPRLIHWIGSRVAEEVERQELDEGQLQGQLLELQMRWDLGEIGDEAYAQQEKALLERLSYIRQAKE